jgi:hypothetical protein
MSMVVSGALALTFAQADTQFVRVHAHQTAGDFARRRRGMTVLEPAPGYPKVRYFKVGYRDHCPSTGIAFRQRALC